MTIRSNNNNNSQPININKKRFKSSYIFILHTRPLGVSGKELYASLHFARPSLPAMLIPLRSRGYRAMDFGNITRVVSAQQQRANPRMMQYVWQTIADYKEQITAINIS